MNSLTTVEGVGNGTWRVITRYDDDLFSAELALEVKAPALDIRSARLDVKRDALNAARNLDQVAGKLLGVRVGPGMTKIVRGVVGGPQGSDRMAELVLESMEMLINAITVPEIRKAIEKAGVSLERNVGTSGIDLNDRVMGEKMVGLMSENPRLKDSCAAFRNISG